MTRYSLQPETYDEIIDRDQSPISEPIPAMIQLLGLGEVYKSVSNDVAYFGMAGDARAAVYAATRDRLYASQIKPLLEQLVQ